MLHEQNCDGLHNKKVLITAALLFVLRLGRVSAPECERRHEPPRVTEKRIDVSVCVVNHGDNVAVSGANHVTIQ